ncbi:histidine kinase [Streptomyces angustmyceticus]|uniref:histidine kinase n=1 Tax=Streptomyces angustmyceticus TaxID=285578 RepID=A0A5J4LNL1_9ACTN|nr:histidine kinase [Streptomyces angustmyceticus]UAL65946.1 two-component sensor histidine kinase [Streptomyces angustmyceticus]GES33572.1 two-component sensor histidine kinase [Streptomyces angustmyceticus]
MDKLNRPLSCGTGFRDWVYAALGAALSLPPLTAALLFAPPRWPAGLRVLGFVCAFTVVTVAMGAPRSARRASVWLANGLLGAGLPEPVDTTGPRWVNRLRTVVWLVPHMVLGGVVTAVSCLAVFGAVAFPSVWLGGEERMTVFGLSLWIGEGWRGTWALLPAVGCLALAAGVTLGGAVLLRRLAPVLLGHRPGERLAAAEEQMNLLAQRNRLAQELHDSIGHTLTASTIQAAVAVELMDSDPAGARRALNSIEETSRAAMDDLDHVLGMLREERPSTVPRPTLSDLGPLVERVRGAGAELAVQVHGDLALVPATVSREAYRVVQEGLTNALRHGGKAGIRLRTTVRDGWLELELTNPVGTGERARQRAGGQGVQGIRDRVRLLRGTTHAGVVEGDCSGCRVGGDGRECGGCGSGVGGPDAGESRWRLLVRIPLRSVS